MTDRSAPASPDSSRSVAEAITGWAKALSDVGGPNTLLWASQRSGGSLDLTTAHPGGVSMLLAGRVTHLSDLVREPAALAEALTVVRDLHARTRRLEQQRGLVTGFLAVGMATWEPPRAGATVAAPVLLRALRLRPLSPAEEDFQIDLARSVEVNPVLVNYLRSVAGIAVDPVGLAHLSRAGSRFDPYPVYAALRHSCAEVPGFDIAPRLILGAFPHAKLPMIADLTENTEWLTQVDVVAALAGDAVARARLAAALPDLEADPDPSRELLVLDADAAQASVVDAVRSGTSLAVHAPHGTGATQTVANVIAALAHAGKRVLVVTPLRATIGELSSRLADAGLADLLLDLTSAATDRHTVAADLGETLARVSELDDDELRKAADTSRRTEREGELVTVRRQLLDHVDAMHERRRPWDVSVHEIQAAMAALAAHKPAPGSRVRLRDEALHRLDRARVGALAQQLRAAAEAGGWSDDPRGDPWYGASITTEEEVGQASDIVTRLAGTGLSEPAAVLDEILVESAMPAASCVDDWDTALRTMRGVRDTLEVFRPEVFDIPLDEHVVATGSRAFRAGQDVKLGWLSRIRVRRQARRMLRPGRPPADLHAELVSARDQRQAWHRLVGAGGRPEISPRLDEAQQTYDALGDDLAWLGHRLATTAEGGDLAHLALPRLRARLRRLAQRLDRLEVLPRVAGMLAELREQGMGEVLDDFARRGVAAEHVSAELEHIWWASLALEVTEADPRCRDHNGPALHEAAERYRQLDREQRDETAALVRARVDQRARWRLSTHPQQVELVRAQAAGERWLLPFGDVFRECEDVLTALHPCLAMSPYAVAQLLPAGACFDLVVVQDASSLSTAEVVSALSRGHQALVVGDPHGAPPSPFVVGPPDGIPGRGDDALESVLHQASALLPVRELDWHHGGADIRLVGWLPETEQALGAPRPDAQAPITFERVEGSAQLAAGDDSAIEWTQAEVERLVQLAMDHARTTPHLSLGVLALTQALADHVETTLREQLRALASHDATDPALAFFGEDRQEPFVVAWLGTASLARDVVLLGVGYGRTLHGRVLHRFPSLAGPGAQYRLSRAAGMARQGLVVVSSLGSQDLDPPRLRTPGALALRELLLRAEQAGAGGGGDDGEAVGEAAEQPALDPLLQDLAARLRQEGLTVAPDLGPGRCPVELAVGHPSMPDHFLVAVETDGPRYAGLLGARGRDRLRVEQLHRLGWHPVRVWTTDLYRDPAREVARLVGTVRGARRAQDAEASLSGDTRGEASPQEPDEVDDLDAPGVSTGPGDASTESESRAGDAAAAAAGSRKRRRRLRRKPEQASEDTDRGWGERPDPASHDEWLQEQRPPHWE